MNCSVSLLAAQEHLLSRREFLQRLGAVMLVANAVRPTDAAPHAFAFPAGADRAENGPALADPTYYMDPGWSG